MALETKERVTRKDVADMHIGETRTFQLPHYRKMKSAQVNLREYGFMTDREYRVIPDRKNVVITVIRTM